MTTQSTRGNQSSYSGFVHFNELKLMNPRSPSGPQTRGPKLWWGVTESTMDCVSSTSCFQYPVFRGLLIMSTFVTGSGWGLPCRRWLDVPVVDGNGIHKYQQVSGHPKN